MKNMILHFCTQNSIIKFSLFLFITLFASPLLAQKKTSKENQQWLQYYNQIKISEKWTLQTDGGYRWKDFFAESSQYILRSGIEYEINPNIRILAGFSHLGFYSKNKISKIEFRPYQEAVIKNKLREIGLNHRFRVEERFFNPVVKGEIQSPNTFNFRFRYSFMASIPLLCLSEKKPDMKILMNIGNEIFINAGKGIKYNFDQNRFIISPTFQYDKDLSISITLNNQFASTSVPTSYKYTNVVWLQIKHKIDFSNTRKGD